MKQPFDVLGLRAWATPEEIRSAYRTKAKQIHPDQFQDPEQKKKAIEQMVELNLAYEEALRLASPRQYVPFTKELPKSEAVRLAEKMLDLGNPGNALRQLERADEKDAVWYYTRGRACMALEQYNEAHTAFRKAVHLDPDNNLYHEKALDAAVAIRHESTVPGKVSRLIRRIGKKQKGKA